MSAGSVWHRPFISARSFEHKHPNFRVQGQFVRFGLASGDEIDLPRTVSGLRSGSGLCDRCSVPGASAGSGNAAIGSRAPIGRAWSCRNPFGRHASIYHPKAVRLRSVLQEQNAAVRQAGMRKTSPSLRATSPRRTAPSPGRRAAGAAPLTRFDAPEHCVQPPTPNALCVKDASKSCGLASCNGLKCRKSPITELDVGRSSMSSTKEDKPWSRET